MPYLVLNHENRLSHDMSQLKSFSYNMAAVEEMESILNFSRNNWFQRFKANYRSKGAILTITNPSPDLFQNS